MKHVLIFIAMLLFPMLLNAEAPKEKHWMCSSAGFSDDGPTLFVSNVFASTKPSDIKSRIRVEQKFYDVVVQKDELFQGLPATCDVSWSKEQAEKNLKTLLIIATEKYDFDVRFIDFVY